MVVPHPAGEAAADLPSPKGAEGGRRGEDRGVAGAGVVTGEVGLVAAGTGVVTGGVCSRSLR